MRPVLDLRLFPGLPKFLWFDNGDGGDSGGDSGGGAAALWPGQSYELWERLGAPAGRFLEAAGPETILGWLDRHLL